MTTPPLFAVLESATVGLETLRGILKRPGRVRASERCTVAVPPDATCPSAQRREGALHLPAAEVAQTTTP
jgi:hypothetical protein